MKYSSVNYVLYTTTKFFLSLSTFKLLYNNSYLFNDRIGRWKTKQNLKFVQIFSIIVVSIRTTWGHSPRTQNRRSKSEKILPKSLHIVNKKERKYRNLVLQNFCEKTINKGQNINIFIQTSLKYESCSLALKLGSFWHLDAENWGKWEIRVLSSRTAPYTLLTSQHYKY